MTMIRLLVKSGLWLAAGVAIVVFAVPLTGFEAASPWQYTVQATGNVVSREHETPDDPIGLTVGPADESGEIGTVKMDQTLDLGVLSFLVIVYVGGTLMGRVLKKRPTTIS